MLKIYYIIVASITTVASIVELIVQTRNIFGSWKREKTETKKALKPKIFIAISILVLLINIYAYSIRKEIIIEPLPPPQIADPELDISGKYFGYFVDDTGHKVNTFLSVETNNNTNYIMFRFKNAYSKTYQAVYSIDKRLLTIEELGGAKVYADNNYVIIESINAEKKWRFKKNI